MDTVKVVFTYVFCWPGHILRDGKILRVSGYCSLREVLQEVGFGDRVDDVHIVTTDTSSKQDAELDNVRLKTKNMKLRLPVSFCCMLPQSNHSLVRSIIIHFITNSCKFRVLSSDSCLSLLHKLQYIVEQASSIICCSQYVLLISHTRPSCTERVWYEANV